MPSSYFEQIPVIIDILLRLKPKSILDLGVGFGKYGFLAREYLEIWGNEDNDFGKFKIRIDGVEGFEKYITPCHRYIYDNIYTTNIAKFVGENSFSYDAVLMIDVLEHLDRETGRKILERLVKGNRNLIISTPSKFHKQEATFSNPLEIHRSYWRAKELFAFGNAIKIPFKNSTIMVIGEDTSYLKKYRLKRIIYDILPGFAGRFL